eukprot:Lithocolla_globosa_v1_NODE_186_length_5337_cov_5.779712.p3 type:complete len:235 gc:universal NODE_186_length_5337_cov_5.779712:2521-3225(+)
MTAGDLISIQGRRHSTFNITSLGRVGRPKQGTSITSDFRSDPKGVRRLFEDSTGWGHVVGWGILDNFPSGQELVTASVYLPYYDDEAKKNYAISILDHVDIVLSTQLKGKNILIGGDLNTHPPDGHLGAEILLKDRRQRWRREVWNRLSALLKKHSLVILNGKMKPLIPTTIENRHIDLLIVSKQIEGYFHTPEVVQTGIDSDHFLVQVHTTVDLIPSRNHPEQQQRQEGTQCV